MTNKGYIIVPSGLRPIHSFDVYGPIVDSERLCEQTIKLFEQIAETEEISPENAVKIVGDYRALARGEPWATGELKLPIINALNEPLKKHPELQPDYKAAFQEDGLYAMRQILDAGEGVIIFSSKIQDWLKEDLPQEITERLGEIYGDRKTKPEAFQRVYASETAKGHRVVTHTADELPELEAAVASGIFAGDKGKLVFVNRNNQISEEKALAAGIDYYVDDLKEVGYVGLVQKE